MKLTDRFSRPAPYVAWAVVSAILLIVTRRMDPYVFAFCAYGTAGVSIVLTSWTLMLNLRAFVWALIGAIPTLFAFALLSTFSWA